jgi:hypothetical protein
LGLWAIVKVYLRQIKSITTSKVRLSILNERQRSASKYESMLLLSMERLLFAMDELDDFTG